MGLKGFFLIGVTYLFFINLVRSELSKGDLKYLDSVLANVPLEHRQYVLLHQLFLGYIRENPQLIPNEWNIPYQDTQKIYKLFLNKMKVLQSQELVKGEICLPSGECFDPDDPGIYPKK